VPFENVHLPAFEFLFARIFIMFSCVKALSVLRPVYTGDFCRNNSMQFLSRSRLQLQNRTCKPGPIFSAICRRDIAGVSNMFVT